MVPIDWPGDKNLYLFNPEDDSIFNMGGTLGLAFYSIEEAKFQLSSELNTISDHETIFITTMLLGNLIESRKRRLCYSSLSETSFKALLGDGKDPLRWKPYRIYKLKL